MHVIPFFRFRTYESCAWNVFLVPQPSTVANVTMEGKMVARWRLVTGGALARDGGDRSILSLLLCCLKVVSCMVELPVASSFYDLKIVGWYEGW